MKIILLCVYVAEYKVSFMQSVSLWVKGNSLVLIKNAFYFISTH